MTVKRVVRFTRHVRSHPSMYFQTPVLWRNLRAAWVQSDPGWLEHLPTIDMSDEEYEAFMEALS